MSDYGNNDFGRGERGERVEREFISRPWFDVNWIKNDDQTRSCHLTTGGKFRQDLKVVLQSQWPEFVSVLDGNLNGFVGSQVSGTQVLQLCEDDAGRLCDHLADYHDQLSEQDRSIPVHLYALLEKLENQSHNHAKANKKFQPRQRQQYQDRQPARPRYY
jgi:hypothetical protein